MTQTCLFCRIMDRDGPARFVHRDERIVAIEDVNPQAPVHVLVIPRRHIATLNDLTPDDDGLVGEMFRRAASIAKDRGIDQSGYRTVFNCNRGAGQSVYHLHLHVVGGRRMAWPPG
jgi:histidine triad (HIT) family protein